MVTLEFRRVLLGGNRLGQQDRLQFKRHFDSALEASRFLQELEDDRENDVRNQRYYNRIFNRVVWVERTGDTTRREVISFRTDPWNEPPDATDTIKRVEPYLEATWEDLREYNLDRVL